MKKALLLIINYFLVLFIGIVLGLFIYIQYYDAISFIAGKSSNVEGPVYLFGLLETLPILYLILPFSMTFYRIRHKEKSVYSVIAYAVFCILTWFLLFPVTMYFRNLAYKTYQPVQEIHQNRSLSKNYFRKANGRYYYFIDDSTKSTASVARLFDQIIPNDRAKLEVLNVSDNSDYQQSIYPFRDSIVKESVGEFPIYVVDAFTFLKEKAALAWNNGLISWLCFCSFGFALCSIYCLKDLSSWKLSNAFFNLFLTALVIAINFFYFKEGFDIVQKSLHELFYQNGHLNFFVTRQIDFPLMLINCLLGLISITVGIVVNKIRESED